MVDQQSDVILHVQKSSIFKQRESSKFLADTKILKTPEKISESQLSENIHFSAQVQKLAKILMFKLEFILGGDFFLSLPVYMRKLYSNK